MQNNLKDDASKTLEKILKQDPHWGPALILKGQLIIETHGKDVAREFFSKSVEQYPNERFLRLVYGQFLINLDDLTEAKIQLFAVTRNDEYRSRAYLHLSQIAMREQKFNTAFEYLKEAKKDENQKQIANYLLGQISETKGDHKNAFHYYKLIDSGPFYFTAQIHATMLLAQQGDVKHARSHLRTIVPMNVQQQKQLYLTESSLLFLSDEKESALKILTNAVGLMPNDLELRYIRSMLAIQIGKIDIAEDDLLMILQTTPNNPFILNALGYAVADQPLRHDDAFAYLEQALKHSPKNPDFLDSMGWLQYQMGNYTVALKYLHEAHSLSNNVEIATHLGIVLWTTGDKKGATQIWKTALKKYPENETLLQTIKKHSDKESLIE